MAKLVRAIWVSRGSGGEGGVRQSSGRRRCRSEGGARKRAPGLWSVGGVRRCSRTAESQRVVKVGDGGRVSGRKSGKRAGWLTFPSWWRLGSSGRPSHAAGERDRRLHADLNIFNFAYIYLPSHQFVDIRQRHLIVVTIEDFTLLRLLLSTGLALGRHC